MKTKLIVTIIIGIVLASIGSIYAQEQSVCSFEKDVPLSENYFVNDPAVVEFLKLYPEAEYLTDNAWEEPLPPQTYAQYLFKDLHLVFQILEYNPENTQECYFINGYKLFNQYTPNLNVLNFQKDPNVIIELLDTIKPRLRGGPTNIDTIQLEKELDPLCGSDAIFVNGVCEVIITDSREHWPVSSFTNGLFFIIFILPFFIPGALIFIVVSKTPRFSKLIILSVSIPAIITILYFLSGLFLGWYPPGYA